MKNKRELKAYMIGGGIASLSAAVYLIQDAEVDGKNITIFNDSENFGGSLDAKYLEDKKGYVMRGIRMFEEDSFDATFDLMSRVPSLDYPDKNLREYFLEYNTENKTCSKSRLVAEGKALEQHSLGLSLKDRLRLVGIIFKKEKNIEYLKIEDYFSKSFFQSNFWYEFCTVFAFEPWHSLIEMRRYFIRFIQDFPVIDTLEGIEVTPYNQYESLIEPVVEWLKKQGVNFAKNKKIIDLDFSEKEGKSLLNKIYCEFDGQVDEISVSENDFIFITVGSMVANTTVGSMTEAPEDKMKDENISWSLWEKIANKQDNFGNPSVFNSHIEQSKWTSFTITCKDNTFSELLKKFIDTKIAGFGGVNLVKSSWFISLVINYKPYFKNQAEGTYICWGYGLYSNKKGDFIKKKMTECSGEEIMDEIIYHLGFQDKRDEIINSLVCLPCLSPFVTSQFLPRAVADRPKVIPDGSVNYAFLGQYCENPQDVVFTVDYSVRCAQKAVYSLLGIKKEVVPIYDGFHHVGVLWKALKTLFR